MKFNQKLIKNVENFRDMTKLFFTNVCTEEIYKQTFVDFNDFIFDSAMLLCVIIVHYTAFTNCRITHGFHNVLGF